MKIRFMAPVFLCTILSYTANNNAFADLLCVQLIGHDGHQVSLSCSHTSGGSDGEDVFTTTAVYACTDPDSECSTDEGSVIYTDTEAGEVDVYIGNDNTNDSGSSGSSSGGGGSGGIGGGNDDDDDDDDSFGGGNDSWLDKLLEGICNACHTGQNDFLLLSQSDKNTFINHEKSYFRDHILKLNAGDKKYIGKGSYIVQNKDLQLIGKDGKVIKAYPDDAIIVTDGVGKPVYVYLGIEKKVMRVKK